MGEKGAKNTEAAAETAEDLVDRLGLLGEVTAKKMFGGYGVFGDGIMFAIVDSGGSVFFRADESTAARYDAAGAGRHGRMPYRSIPDPVVSDDAVLAEWGSEALGVARSHKR